MSVAPVSLDELRVAQMLPDIALGSVPLRSPRSETTVIVWRHPAGCVECDRYVRDLAVIEDEFRTWDGRLLVLVSSLTDTLAPPFGTLAGSDRVEGAGVIVADRYGQVFYVAKAGVDHALPSVRTLAEWLKYLGTLCPE